MSPGWCRPTATGVELSVRVTPGARVSSVLSVDGDILRLKIAAPPVDGKANGAVCRFVADMLGVRASAVEVVRGATSRNKIVAVTGITTTAVGSAFPHTTT